MIDYCKSKGIIVETYSPVAHGAALGNPVIGAIAEKYGVSIPQLCIKYDLHMRVEQYLSADTPESENKFIRE